MSILDVKPQGPDRGEAIARIRAVEKIYAQGSDKLLSQTDDPALNITYRLVKQGNSWRRQPGELIDSMSSVRQWGLQSIR